MTPRLATLLDTARSIQWRSRFIAMLCLALASTGAGAWQWERSRQLDAIEQARRDALVAAEAGVPLVLSYGSNNAAADLAEADDHMTTEYREKFTATVAPAIISRARRDGVSSSASIVESGVSEATSDSEVTLLVFVNQIVRDKDHPEPQTSGSRLRVVMKREDGEWRISDITPR